MENDKRIRCLAEQIGNRDADRIRVLPASENPLSADVVVIKGDTRYWIFDVGSNEEAVNLIQSLTGKKTVVLSHFHADHATNIDRIDYEELYLGEETRKKLGLGTAVTETVSWEDGVRITLFPIPSTHAKGCVGMMVGDTVAFLGDATYATGKHGQTVYNVNLLKELIVCLGELPVSWFALSHDESLIKPMEDVIRQLKKLYNKRRPGESYLALDNETI